MLVPVVVVFFVCLLLSSSSLGMSYIWLYMAIGSRLESTWWKKTARPFCTGHVHEDWERFFREKIDRKAFAFTQHTPCSHPNVHLACKTRARVPLSASFLDFSTLRTCV